MLLSDPSCKVDSLMEDIKNNDFGDDSVAVVRSFSPAH
jgi:hypothetical protein